MRECAGDTRRKKGPSYVKRHNHGPKILMSSRGNSLWHSEMSPCVHLKTYHVGARHFICCKHITCTLDNESEMGVLDEGWSNSHPETERQSKLTHPVWTCSRQSSCTFVTIKENTKSLENEISLAFLKQKLQVESNNLVRGSPGLHYNGNEDRNKVPAGPVGPVASRAHQIQLNPKLPHKLFH